MRAQGVNFWQILKNQVNGNLLTDERWRYYTGAMGTKDILMDNDKSNHNRPCTMPHLI